MVSVCVVPGGKHAVRSFRLERSPAFPKKPGFCG